jgi:hypothetical protein
MNICPFQLNIFTAILQTCKLVRENTLRPSLYVVIKWYSWIQDEDFSRDGLHLNRSGASQLGELYSRVCELGKKCQKMINNCYTWQRVGSVRKHQKDLERRRIRRILC